MSESRTALAHSLDTSGDGKFVKCNGNGTSEANIKEEVDRSCAKIEKVVCKPMSFERTSKEVVGKNKTQPIQGRLSGWVCECEPHRTLIPMAPDERL